MKGRSLCIAPEGAALVVDGELEDLILTPKSPRLSVGDLASAKVTRALGGKGGAFCDLGGETGFLREAKGLRSGDTLTVQVTSLPEPGKAITVSSRILIKGPRLILTPDAPGVNVSRQIRNEDERDRLKNGATAALEALGLDCGVIVRTGAEGEEGQYLQSEMRLLAQRMSAGTELGSAQQAATRDWISPRPDQIVTTSGIASTLRSGGLWDDDRLLDRLTIAEDPFDAVDVWGPIEALKHPRVSTGAGSMFIEPTRAFVAVDVNTGGDFSPAAGLKANTAAARDLPRHLRLRGLGGQIVVDFAPMPKKDRKTFEGALKAAFRRDPIDTTLVGWSQMGLFELQRKRERWPLSEVM